eukprot:TRINITY_DN41572_c0_g1_i1.p1 TRINITY_DN41572_c0_g1~~TRINITY_DN41572_c0_g1_i1.p1  ORF type:complete len:495 (-),score=23.92 TRINITY_DN41572_c0_g1_i1:307-1701(-)
MVRRLLSPRCSVVVAFVEFVLLATSSGDLLQSLGASLESVLVDTRNRRLLSIGQTHNLSLRHASNMAMTRLGAADVAIAWSDSGHERRAALSRCSVQNNGDLTCSSPKLCTDAPVNSEERSLAIAAIWSDRVFIVWKQGRSPFDCRLKICNVDLSSCGDEVRLLAYVDGVSVVALSTSTVVVAYADAQRNHRGAVIACTVATLGVTCSAEYVFHAGPISAPALAALRTDTIVSGTTTSRFVVAYETKASGKRAGELQPCDMIGETIVCFPSSAAPYSGGPSESVELLTLAPNLIAVAFADRAKMCPAGIPTARRRSRYVCNGGSDGHPSIASVRLCRVTYEALTISQPLLECGDATVVDDGYDTGPPVLARLNASAFGAAYACVGCGDQGPLALLRHCGFPDATVDERVGSAPPGPPNCSLVAPILLNGNTTQFIAASSAAQGLVVAYNDYGGKTYGSGRYVQF